MTKFYVQEKPRCKGTKAKGGPCQAYPLKGSEYCSAHDLTRPEEDRFGSPIWSAHAGASAKPRVPKPMELAAQIVQAQAHEFLNPYLHTLGLELRDDGQLYRLERGGAKVTATYEGEVTVSDVTDLAAQIVVVEKLLDRIWGRPKQVAELSGPGGGPIETAGQIDLKKLTPGEIKDLRGLLERAAVDGAPE